jgi:predicted nucleic acid-binding protein
MTAVVRDSGPFTHLWQIDQWQAFRTFEAMHVPAQVAREVARHVPLAEMPTYTGRDVIVDEVSEQEIMGVRQASPGGLTLHEADLATLALARRQSPDLVLTDDLATRQAVEAQGQMPMGSVGVLLRAYKAGILDAVALEGLFVHSTRYLSPNFQTYVRRLIAEMITE